ncbi:VIT1/CCC1 transporter family protein [Patescibacteria group bacterium]|nr:VIT1/CCC1 transporter family protein [Patescibacteria group bacterium]
MWRRRNKYLKLEEEIELTLHTYLKQVIFGGIDGIITTFAVVAGFSGAKETNPEMLGIGAVLLFGFSNLFGDATSMGLGNFVAERSEQKLNKGKKLKSPIFTSIATMASFIIFGLTPLIPYIVKLQFSYQFLFFISCITSLMGLTVLGIFRFILTHEKWYKSLAEVLGIGTISALVAYFVGTFF